MVNVFGNMVKKMNGERFMKNVCESVTHKHQIKPRFMESYNQYQKRVAERKKDKELHSAKF